MIFFDLFWTFSKIGIFNFGGGYAMLSLIQNEVVQHHGWMTSSEFTDIIGISQMTPGPIGINAATYVGYTAVVKAGYSPLVGILGSAIATISVLWLPFILMLLISRLLIKNKEHPLVKTIFQGLRPVIIGLIASAALMLMNRDNFSSPKEDLWAFIFSCLIFAGSFIAVAKYKVNVFLVLISSGILGYGIYSFM